MDKSINNIGRHNSLLQGFQRVFDQPASNVSGRMQENEDHSRQEVEVSNKRSTGRPVDVQFYASSGGVKTVNPGDKGNHFDINV